MIYVHRKSGKRYKFLHAAINEADLKPVIVYQEADGDRIWVRPTEEFVEKFVHEAEEKPRIPFNLHDLISAVKALTYDDLVLLVGADRAKEMTWFKENDVFQFLGSLSADMLTTIGDLVGKKVKK